MRCLLLGLILSSVGCHNDKPAADPKDRVVPVTAANVAVRDVPIYLDGLGNVTAFKTVTVRSLVDGRLNTVQFKEGQTVRAGDVLAQVDPRPFEVLLKTAQGALLRDTAQLHDTTTNLDRYKALSDQKLVAQQQVDDTKALVGGAQGAVQMDEAQIASAHLSLEYARITSPIDGVTGVRQVDPGNVVHPADTGGIVIITQIDPISVLFSLPQDDLHRVAAELLKGKLTVEAWSRDGLTLLGKGDLQLIDNQINQATASMKLKAVFANPKKLLWPNQFVKARLLLTTKKGAVTVPSIAIQRGPKGQFVYVIGADSIVSPRPVQIDDTEGDLALIKSGLQPGESVVVDGQNQLRPGSKVTTRADGKSEKSGDKKGAPSPGPKTAETP